jgi:hypothetical protein
MKYDDLKSSGDMEDSMELGEGHQVSVAFTWLSCLISLWRLFGISLRPIFSRIAAYTYCGLTLA